VAFGEATMALKALIVIAGLIVAGPDLAAAQGAPAPDVGNQIVPAQAQVQPRIEIHPGGRLLYRQCTGWYELQYRPSGTVLYPGRHCWWVRG
jgi:hypothetical protein